MDSFILWLGGKKSLRQEIVNRIPEHKIYAEVFGGAGWVLFHKTKSSFEVYNDLCGELANLFLQAKYHPGAIQNELKFMLPSRQLFNTLKQHSSLTEIQRATYFFWLIHFSFGAKGTSYNSTRPSKSLINLKKRLEGVAERLDKVLIENLDFADCIKKFDSPNTFFYLDPPYYNTTDYQHLGQKFSQEDHLKLAQMLKGIKGKWLLSYNDCSYIRELYSDYFIESLERHNNYNPSGSKYKELLIRNYPLDLDIETINK